MARNSSGRSTRTAFLNLPYDSQHEKLYLAFIAGLCGFGLIPHATTEIASSQRRLDGILVLVRRCAYSFHDLSRVELDETPPRTPRFNMPFELGLAVATAKASRHQWFVFESKPHRLKKSLSDLDGTDPHIHDGEPFGVLRALANALSRTKNRPTLKELKQIYADTQEAAETLKEQMKGGSLFEAAAFHDLVILARRFAGSRISSARK